MTIGSKRGTAKITAYYGTGKYAAKYKIKIKVKESKQSSNTDIGFGIRFERSVY